MAQNTPAAAQDADLVAQVGVNYIIRFLLQASGDPSSKTFTLRAQKNGSGGYFPVAVGNPATGTINNQPVATGADDAQQVGTTMTVTGTTIGASLDATNEYVGIRFGSVNIPKGATITAAYMRVVPSGTGEDEPQVTIAGFAQDNTAAFTTTASDITNRPITSNTVAWSSADLGATGASYHNTPSLVSIVQEIIDRSGWETGNAIGFRIQGGATTTRDLTIESYENTGNNPPQLYVEYTYSPEIFVSPSSNIAAGGEVTTQRLTGGTGTFTAGRIWDDENGQDSIDIGEDGNTELAWCIQLKSGLAPGTYFDLLVYDGDTPLEGTAARITVDEGEEPPEEAELAGAPLDSPDELSAGATAPAALSGSQREQPDRSTGAAAAPVAASGAILEGKDRSSGSMTAPSGFSAALKDQGDTAQASMGTPAATADAALREAPDRVSSGAVAPVVASGAVTDQPDRAQASAAAPAAISAALREQPDSLAAAVAAAISGTASLLDQPDQAASSMAVAVSISASLEDLPDRSDGLAGSPMAVWAGAMRDADDGAAGSVALTIGLAASLRDELDRIAAAASSAASITSALLDTPDGPLATVVASVSASAALLEQDLQAIARVALAAAAEATLQDVGDLVRGRSVLVVVETAGGFVAKLLVAERVYTLNVEARTFELSAGERSSTLMGPA
jgi:hypothetical protein